MKPESMAWRATGFAVCTRKYLLRGGAGGLGGSREGPPGQEFPQSQNSGSRGWVGLTFQGLISTASAMGPMHVAFVVKETPRIARRPVSIHVFRVS